MHSCANTPSVRVSEITNDVPVIARITLCPSTLLAFATELGEKKYIYKEPDLGKKEKKMCDSHRVECQIAGGNKKEVKEHTI